MEQVSITDRGHSKLDVGYYLLQVMAYAQIFFLQIITSNSRSCQLRTDYFLENE